MNDYKYSMRNVKVNVFILIHYYQTHLSRLRTLSREKELKMGYYLRVLQSNKLIGVIGG